LSETRTDVQIDAIKQDFRHCVMLLKVKIHSMLLKTALIILLYGEI
jgi:hypothetical protein